MRLPHRVILERVLKKFFVSWWITGRERAGGPGAGAEPRLCDSLKKLFKNSFLFDGVTDLTDDTGSLDPP